MKEYFHARVGATAQEPENLCKRADIIVSKDSVNPDDPSPSPALSVITAKTMEVRDKISEAEDSHMAREELKILAKELYSLLRDFCLHVDDSVAKGDKEKVLRTGCLPDKTPEAHGNPRDIFIDRIENIAPQYSVKVFLKKPLVEDLHYDGQIAIITGEMPEDENAWPWVNKLSGAPSTKLIFSGLSRGVDYGFRLRGNDRGRTGRWCQVKRFIPQ